MALRHGTPTAPWWVPWLDMAEAWGRPPWELLGNGEESWDWIMRYKAYRNARLEIEREQLEKLKNGRKS